MTSVMSSPNLVENFVEMPLTIHDIRTCLFHEMEATAILNVFRYRAFQHLVTLGLAVVACMQKFD